MRDADEAIDCVFIAQSRHRCSAAVRQHCTWSFVELPGLALDTIGEVIVTAHFAHERAARSGTYGDKEKWCTIRDVLNDALANAVRPLTTLLATGSRPITVRLSGWLHAVPIASVLIAESGYRQPIIATIGRSQRARGAQPRRTWKLAAVAAPGNYTSVSYLARALDDVEYVSARLPNSRHCGGTGTLADLRDALESAEIVVLAGHGVADNDPSRSHLVCDDGNLTAADLADLNLTGLELVVVAACEAGTIDRTHPAHPFNPTVAWVSAGATFACGPMWQVGDDVASKYTRAIIDAIAAGSSPVNAHLVAARQVGALHPTFRDITMFAADEATVAAWLR